MTLIGRRGLRARRSARDALGTLSRIGLGGSRPTGARPPVDGNGAARDTLSVRLVERFGRATCDEAFAFVERVVGRPVVPADLTLDEIGAVTRAIGGDP